MRRKESWSLPKSYEGDLLEGDFRDYGPDGIVDSIIEFITDPVCIIAIVAFAASIIALTKF